MFIGKEKTPYVKYTESVLFTSKLLKRDIDLNGTLGGKSDHRFV